MKLSRDYEEYNRRVILHKLKERDLVTADDASTPDSTDSSVISLSDDFENLSSFMKESGLQ